MKRTAAKPQPAEKQTKITKNQHEKLVQSAKKAQYTLSTLEDTPEYLRELYVHTGYRVHPTFNECVRSLFHFDHNEAVNIWTSILSAAVFVVFGIYLAFIWLSRPDNTGATNGVGAGAAAAVDWADVAVFGIYIFTAVFAFSASTIFHLFACLSASAYSKTSRLDYTGIALLICGSFYPPLYYAFNCEPIARVLYLGMITSLSAMCITMFLIPRYTGEKYRALRTFVFGATALSGFLPLLHIVLTRGGVLSMHDDVASFLLRVCFMYALYTIGALFYLTRVPERFLPGWCDVIFHSHQFWHLFVLAATVCHFFNCVNLFVINKRSPASCFGLTSIDYPI